MAECIIARGGSYGGGSGGGANIPIIADRCSILVTVKDSTGSVIPDSSVHCNDGGTWYNYHTNERGQALFMANSGQVDISAWNFSLNQNCRYFDQNSVFSNNVDAPVGTVKNINLSLTKGPSTVNKIGVQGYLAETQTSMTSNIYDFSNVWMNNYKFFAYNYVNIKLFGGGGGGDYALNGSTGGGGGGGGGATYVNNISIGHNRMYKFSLGDGGKCGYSNLNTQNMHNRHAGSGGTTSAFGYVANGGSGGYGANGGTQGRGISFNGGNGGRMHLNGNNSEDPNSGGGGGGGSRVSDRTTGGTPCGGNGGYGAGSGSQGQYPGGGGGGAGINTTISGTNRSGGYGGPGGFNFTFR